MYYEMLLPLHHRLLCSRPHAQIKIQNLLQILLTFAVHVYIYFGANLSIITVPVEPPPKIQEYVHLTKEYKCLCE